MDDKCTPNSQQSKSSNLVIRGFNVRPCLLHVTPTDSSRTKSPTYKDKKKGRRGSQAHARSNSGVLISAKSVTSQQHFAKPSDQVCNARENLRGDTLRTSEVSRLSNRIPPWSKVGIEY